MQARLSRRIEASTCTRKPVFFCFPHGLLRTAPVSSSRWPFGVSTMNRAGVNLCRSRCVAFGVRATEERARCPQYGCGVRTWSMWVHLGPTERSTCLRQIWQHDLYTIRLVPTPSERLVISPDAHCSRHVDRLPEFIGICDTRAVESRCVRNVPTLIWRPVILIDLRFLRDWSRRFPQAARLLDKFGIVSRCGSPDTSGQPGPSAMEALLRADPVSARLLLHVITWCPTG